MPCQAARRASYFLKGDMPMIYPPAAPRPDSWDDWHGSIGINPERGPNPKYRGTGTL
jgi:hypothetical protein